VRPTAATWAWRGAAAIGALALAAFVGARGVAASMAESHAGEALRIAPGFEPALVALAQQRLKAGRIGEAEHLARAAVRRDPLDVDAVATLGLALADEGRASQAEALMTLAAGRSWRSSLAHAWLFERRLAEGRLVPALDDADSLLRREESGDLRGRVFAILAMIADDNAARPALVAAWPRTRPGEPHFSRLTPSARPTQARPGPCSPPCASAHGPPRRAKRRHWSIG
jgi:tetratricopeptide (TPR) repeat protein